MLCFRTRPFSRYVAAMMGTSFKSTDALDP